MSVRIGEIVLFAIVVTSSAVVEAQQADVSPFTDPFTDFSSVKLLPKGWNGVRHLESRGARVVDLRNELLAYNCQFMESHLYWRTPGVKKFHRLSYDATDPLEKKREYRYYLWEDCWVPQSSILVTQTADNCPEDPTKTDPGRCGCGTPDTAPSHCHSDSHVSGFYLNDEDDQSPPDINVLMLGAGLEGRQGQSFIPKNNMTLEYVDICQKDPRAVPWEVVLQVETFMVASSTSVEALNKPCFSLGGDGTVRFTWVRFHFPSVPLQEEFEYSVSFYVPNIEQGASDAAIAASRMEATPGPYLDGTYFDSFLQGEFVREDTDLVMRIGHRLDGPPPQEDRNGVTLDESLCATDYFVPNDADLCVVPARGSIGSWSNVEVGQSFRAPGTIRLAYVDILLV